MRLHSYRSGWFGANHDGRHDTGAVGRHLRYQDHFVILIISPGRARGLLIYKRVHMNPIAAFPIWHISHLLNLHSCH